MRGPTARVALFALALLMVHSNRHSRVPSSTTVAVSGFAAALELDPMLVAFDEGAHDATAADAAATTTTTGPHQHARNLWSLQVVWDELGRFFARFDPHGHKKSHGDHEPCDDDKQAWAMHGSDGNMGGIQHVMDGATVLRANDTVVNVTASATEQALRRRRHLLRGSVEDDKDSDHEGGATIMARPDEAAQLTQGGGHDLAGKRLARTEEVETLRHEQLWALSRGDKEGEGKMLGEAYERISSSSVVFLEPPESEGDSHEDLRVEPKAVLGAADGHAAADGNAAGAASSDHKRRRELLHHHLGVDQFDDDDDDFGDVDFFDEEEDDWRPTYYSKDGGDWVWQTHAHGGLRRDLQQAMDGVEGVDEKLDSTAALVIDADDPETAVASLRRPSPAEVRAMTPEEQAALRERDREALENALRKASREEEANRSEPTVAKSLDTVLQALAMRPPVRIQDIPKRRALQVTAAANGGQSAAAQRASALVSAIAGSITEQQKAEIRQAVYDAAVALVREAAREAMEEAGYGNSDGTKGTKGDSGNKARASGGYSNGRGSAYGTGGNEDQYQAAANAILNVMSRNNPNAQPAARAAMQSLEERRSRGGASAAVAGASESTGRAVDTGRGTSLLEAARAAARRSASAGRPPAQYNPYPPHRRRRLRGLKNASFRVPVPFTLDPASNATNPRLVFNASDAVFINLRTRQDEDGAIQVTAQSMSGGDGHEQQVPWPTISGLGPALNGLSSTSSDGQNPTREDKGKHPHWADALLDMIRRFHGKRQQQPGVVEYHASRMLEAAQQPEAPTTTEPAKQPETVNDSLQDAPTPADGAVDAVRAEGTGAPRGGLNPDALAELLQRPFIPPVPGEMGAHPGDEQQQPAGSVDAFGNTVQPAVQEQGQGQGQGPTSMKATQQNDKGYEEEEENDEKGETQPDPVGLGDAFYDRAASQLLGHSGSNFKKMQAVVNQILADEGFDV